MKGLKFDYSNLSGVEFLKCPMIEVTLVHAKMNSTDFSGANLSRATIKHARIASAVFVGTNIQKADFSESAILDTDLSKATYVRDAKFNGASINNVIFPIGLQKIKFSSAILANLNIKGRSLNGSNMEAARIVNVDFTGADLSNVILKHAQLDAVDLSKCKLNNSNLEYASFENATMLDVDIGGAKLKYARFQKLNASNTKFGYASSLFRLSVDNVSMNAICDSHPDKVSPDGRSWLAHYEWQQIVKKVASKG